MRERLVVVGNGMAGIRAVEEILARGGAFDITVLGEEPHGSYNRILLSGVLGRTHDAAEIVTHPVTWYEENGITLHAGVRVTAVDRERRVVIGEVEGRKLKAEGSREPGSTFNLQPPTFNQTIEVPYDRLILATGSRPRVPEIAGVWSEGGPRPGVFLFRTLDDCRGIAEYAAGCRRAVVIGGGLLGLEAAYGLKDHGVEVTIVHHRPHLMNRQLDPQAGAILRSTVEAMGVRVLLDAEPEALPGNAAVSGVALRDGREIEADMVVLACGIMPNVEPAVECGLAVERAIVVDDQMRSVDDPAIYAVGECAQHQGRVYGLVAPLWEQARVLAEHLTGRGGAYGGSRVATRLKVMGVELAAMGIPEPADERDEVVQFIEPKRGVYQKLVIREGALVGAIFLGDTARAPYAMQAFDRGTPLPESRAALLFDVGSGVSPEAMPEEATVCHCNGVSKGDIRECVAGGGCSIQAVMRATRAGTGCGSCKGLLREFVERFRKSRPAPAGAER